MARNHCGKHNVAGGGCYLVGNTEFEPEKCDGKVSALY